MRSASAVQERPQSLGEEIANSVSHGFGLLAAVLRGVARALAAVALLAPLVAFAGRQCEIPGSKIHWIADYCMAQLQTDDEIPAMDCIAKEDAIRFPSECAAKRHYKQAMCELSISRGTTKDDVERCVADPEFVGRTVRRGGVGG